MKRCTLLGILILTWSFSALAEKIELFPPIPEATAYEVKFFSPETNKSYIYKSRSTEFETNKISSGNYIMQARYKNANEKWSAWTNNANLKIRKSNKTTVTAENVVDKLPFGVSLGTDSLHTSTASEGEILSTIESVMRFRGFIEKRSYKFAFNYGFSSNLTRFDSSLLKKIYPNTSVGVNYWMMNFKAGKVIADYSQLFAEGDYAYHFYERWHARVTGGVGMSLNYYIRPEITYSVPFQKELIGSVSLTYEKSRVDQSGFLFKASGAGILLNLNYFLEI